MTNDEIVKVLFENRDIKYRDFHAPLIPTVCKEHIIGVRTPFLRKYAKELSKESDICEFLKILPHHYYEENNLHAFIIEQFCDFEKTICALDEFLPFVDNWATCDMLRPKCFKKNREELIFHVKKWIFDDRTYVKRFGIVTLMSHFLDVDFDEEYLTLVANIESDEYYVKMAVAWFFATALSKQYDITVSLLKENKLEKWTHNKAIQKAIESRCLIAEQKSFLKTMKIK